MILIYDDFTHRDRGLCFTYVHRLDNHVWNVVGIVSGQDRQRLSVKPAPLNSTEHNGMRIQLTRFTPS